MFAGAGISAVAPSDVPSWWHFNVAVLDRILAHAKGSWTLPAEVRAALDAVTLEDVGVALFSQIVVDSFAGASWFELLGHLDGTVPSQCHDALALLAREGLLAAIVTTNFDTLTERAFDDLGVPLLVHMPSGDGAPPALTGDGPCRLVKVHGSVTEGSSMIDLASQKVRGISPRLRAWLSRAFAEHPLLVAGFSGADLDLGDDYFGLRAALPHVPWMRWVTRGDRAPLPAASAVVGSARHGGFVEGALPDVLSEVGIEVPHPRTASTAAPANPHDWVDAWLAGPAASPEGSAILAARVLDVAGQGEAATTVRTVARTSINEALKRGVTFREALNATLAFAQFGNDVMSSDVPQALTDLNASRRIVERILSTEVLEKLGPEAREEINGNTSGVLLNIAMALVGLSDVEGAQQALDDAKPFVEAMPAERAADRRAAAFVVSGAIAHSQERPRDALLCWRQAGLMAARAGNVTVALMAMENRRRTLVLLRELDLAEHLRAEAERLRALAPGSRAVDLVALELKPAAREEVFALMLLRLRDETGRGGERLDEVLYSAWALVDAEPDLRPALRDALAQLDPTALERVEPHQRAIVSVARHTLEDGDQSGLLDPVPEALTTWFAGNMATEQPSTIPQARLILHPELRTALITIARRWAQRGVTCQREQSWEDAHRQFLTGGCAFALAGEVTEAERALLYCTDALMRLERDDEAGFMLGWLEAGSDPANTADVLGRRVKLLVKRVAAGAMEPGRAIEEADVLVRRLERVTTADALGAGYHAAANLHFLAGRPLEAVALARKAEALFSDDHYRELARASIALFQQQEGPIDAD